MGELEKKSIVAAAKAEIQKERVRQATGKLKSLYAQRDQAKKILRNVEREIADYLQELETEDDDLSEGEKPDS